MSEKPQTSLRFSLYFTYQMILNLINDRASNAKTTHLNMFE